MSTESTSGSDTEATRGTAPTPSAPPKEPAADDDPYSLWLLTRLFKSRRKETDVDFPLSPVFLRFAVAAPIMLVGLPLGALAIVHLTGCCSNESLTSFFTFWGSVLAGMLALFGMLIAAVFVITAFRIDKSAAAEARSAAEQTVTEFILKYRDELVKQIDDWMDMVKSHKRDTIAYMNDVKKDAESAIKEIQAQVDQKANETKDAMDQAAQDVAAEKGAAVERIGTEFAEVERSAQEAKAAIEAEVAEVERLAAEAGARLEGQQGQQGDESSPDDTQG